MPFIYLCSGGHVTGDFWCYAVKNPNARHPLQFSRTDSANESNGKSTKAYYRYHFCDACKLVASDVQTSSAAMGLDVHSLRASTPERRSEATPLVRAWNNRIRSLRTYRIVGFETVVNRHYRVHYLLT